MVGSASCAAAAMAGSMKQPRPRPRLVPRPQAAATRKVRISRVGSVTREAGFSGMAERSSAALEPRECELKQSSRVGSGAFFSCRTSQLTRVVGRPSRGASRSTWLVAFPVRRSAVMTRWPTVSGMRMAPARCPKLGPAIGGAANPRAH